MAPAPGMAFLVLGAFWFFAGAPRFYAALREQGVRLGVLIYDMFPATHPEYTTPDTTQYFNQALNEALFFWDFALAISEYSAAAFRRVAAQRGYPAIETVAIPLAHSFGLAAAPRPEWLDTWPAALGDLEGRDYILSVSTIEARKNHQLLFHAWQRMIEAGDNPPPLVLVGRPGWRVGDFMGQLQATNHLDGRILVVHGLSDAELEAVYRGCLFTVMPSHAEGWGLAVGESLSFGRPAIAANTSALPEVGGDLVTYADPGSVPEWVAKLRAWLGDRAALAQAQARIGREFTPRRWPEVARHFLDEVARLRRLPRREVVYDAKPLHLPLGETVMAGIAVAAAGGGSAASLGALSQAISLHSGWYPAEAGCTWMRGRTARFIASAEAAPGTRLDVTLDLTTPPWPSPNAVTFQVAGGEAVRMALPHDQPFAITATGVLDEAGLLVLDLRLDQPGAENSPDPRRLCLAMRGITLRPAAAQPEPVRPAVQVTPAPAPPRPGLFNPVRKILRQANAARDAGDWAGAAQLYAAYLQRRPAEPAILVQHGNMLSMAGAHGPALDALAQAWRLGDAAAPDMFGHALTRINPAQNGAAGVRAWVSPGGRALVDISALLAGADMVGPGLGTEDWAARRWRLGLARALAECDTELLLHDAAHGVLRHLPAAAARLLLERPEAARREALGQFVAQLDVLVAAAGDHLLVLGLMPATAGLRAAREAGARVTLVLAQPAVLTRPSRLPPGVAAAHRAALFGRVSAFDGLLLAETDPAIAAALAAGGRADLGYATLPPRPLADIDQPLPAPDMPPGAYVLTDGTAPWLRQAWSILAETQPGLPALLSLDGAAEPIAGLDADPGAALAGLLADCRFAIAQSDAGGWPGLAMAAAQARTACLTTAELDPLDLRATAATLARMLDAQPRPMPLAMPVTEGFGALAEAALGAVISTSKSADPAPPAAAPLLARPLAEQGWALGLGRGA